MTRLGIEERVRLRPEVLLPIWNRFGPFQCDWVAAAALAHCIPAGWPKVGQCLLFFARFAGLGALGVDILAQNLAYLSHACCFPPSGLTGKGVDSATI